MFVGPVPAEEGEICETLELAHLPPIELEPIGVHLTPDPGCRHLFLAAETAAEADWAISSGGALRVELAATTGTQAQQRTAEVAWSHSL